MILVSPLLQKKKGARSLNTISEDPRLFASTFLNWVSMIHDFTKKLIYFISDLVYNYILLYHTHRPDLLHKWPLLQVCYRPLKNVAKYANLVYYYIFPKDQSLKVL